MKAFRIIASRTDVQCLSAPHRSEENTKLFNSGEYSHAQRICRWAETSWVYLGRAGYAADRSGGWLGEKITSRNFSTLCRKETFKSESLTPARMLECLDVGRGHRVNLLMISARESYLRVRWRFHWVLLASPSESHRLG